MSRWKLAWSVLFIAFLVAGARLAYAAGEVDPIPAALVSGRRVSDKWRIANPELEEKAQRAGLPLSFSLEVRKRSYPDAAVSQGHLTLPNGEFWRGVWSEGEEEAEVRCIGRFESGDGFCLQISGGSQGEKEIGIGCDLWCPYFVLPVERPGMDRLLLKSPGSRSSVSYRRD